MEAGLGETFSELNLAHSSCSCPENLCSIDFKYNWMAQELLDQFLDTVLDFQQEDI